MGFEHPNELVSEGARMLMWSMIVELAGGIAVVIAMGAVGASYLIPGAPPRAVLPALYSAMETSLAIAVVIAVASLALQWSGWSRLRNADRLRYGVGRTGVALLVIGFALAIAAEAAIIVLFLPAIAPYLNSFYQAAPALPPPSAISGFVAVAGIALVGAIFAIVGEVMIWIGLWRLDEDYGAGLVRASIVLEILAVVVALMSAFVALAAFAAIAMAFVSYILIVVGLHGISARAREVAARGGSPPPV